MIDLNVTTYNNIKGQSIKFNKGLNVITGINGSGKTNLLKSISNNYPKNILISPVKNFNFNINTFNNNINNKDINIINNNCNTVKFNFLLNRADKINLTETKTLRDLMYKIIDIIAPYDNGSIEIDRQRAISYGCSTDHCDEKREYVVKEIMVWRRHNDKYDDLGYFGLYNEPSNNPSNTCRNTYRNYALINFILEQLQTDKEWKDVCDWTNVIRMSYPFSIIEAILKIVRVDDVSNFFWFGFDGPSKKLIEERLNIYDKLNLFKSHNNFVELKLECERVKGNISYIDTMFSGNTINTVMNGIRHVSAGEKQALDFIFLSHFIENAEYKFLSNDGNLIDKPDIILLDEPDCFLNPQLAKTILEVIKKEFVEKDIQIIMTAHNPSTVAYCKEEELFWMENGEVLQDEKRKTKQDILTALTPGLILLQNEYDVIGNLIKTFDTSGAKNILLVEGWTDKIYLESAGLKNVDIIPCKSAQNVAVYFDMLKRIVNKTTKLIALFDNDVEGRNCYNEIKGDSKLLIKSKFDNVIDNNKLNIPIEFLFDKSVLDQQAMIEKDNTFATSDTEDNAIKDNDSLIYYKLKKDEKKTLKENFANYVKKNADNINFDGFKETLDAINSIINK